ncbi:hypothetical protein KP509_31G033000 [Ceratopteris richardii]|nr:hypothetical protein KP509_31G033000 [Ceratopteris richardii]KAH7288592.1 hypothetical protein KP509_31G033000 [Ceratopteris richardii]
MNVREGDERPVSSSESSTSSYNTPKFDGGTLRSGTNKEGFVSNVEGLEMTSVQDRATSNPTSELSERDIFNMENSNKARQWIQDMINADLERRYKSDDDDSDEQDPLFIEEDDPNWLDEPDDGWGFKVSDLFKEDFRVTNRRKYDKDDDDDVQDIPNTDWDFQPQNFSALDVDSMSWTQTVLHDPSPLVALIYERYGKRGRECYHVLRELEDAANRMWKSHVLPPRLIKVNASFEEDLVAAMGIEEFPTLIFVKGGKLIHYQSGYLTSDDLLRIISYFYHGAARPACLKKVPLGKKAVKI